MFHFPPALGHPLVRCHPRAQRLPLAGGGIHYGQRHLHFGGGGIPCEAAAPVFVGGGIVCEAAAPVFVGGGITPRLAYYNIKRAEVWVAAQLGAPRLSVVGRPSPQMVRSLLFNPAG